jgi:hypothetical protein
MKYIIILLIFYCFQPLHAQDSINKKNSIRNLTNDAYNNFIVARKQVHDSVFFQKSERDYKLFAGRVIRRIIVQKLGFGENVLDTTRAMLNTISRFANNLQPGTKQFIIEQFMFVKAGDAVDPFQLADNERLLRSLDFIKDSRIHVKSVPNTLDSVDLIVVVRDVFSIGAKATASGISDFSGSIYNANLFGRAQRLEYTLLYDSHRKPKFGSGILFRKYNIFGSFINVEGAYTTINKGISLGTENETSTYFKLDRPLYSPNAKFAGGLNLDWNHSTNRYEKPDSIFHYYRYRFEDVWVGYNIGTQKAKFYSEYREDRRRRQFAAIRFFDQYFSQRPNLDYYDYRYTNKRYVLGEFTWYKINFYETNYIYGFGVTEDLPVGYSRKITAGPSKIDSLNRFYLGYQYDHWLVNKQGNYFNYTIALGTNYYKKTFQDNSLLFNLNWMSRLFSFKKFKVRQNAGISYAGIGNYKAYDQLRINNEYGLQKFNTDSAYGSQRLTIGIETVIFTRWEILGFKIGFFAFGKNSLLAPQGKSLFEGTNYPAIGGGFRTRNENLIFGTIEGRVTWFPRTIENINTISFSLSSNIRIKFPESFVQAPWFATIK